MMDYKLRQAYKKANQAIQNIYDHSNGKLELFITSNPYLNAYHMSLDNLHPSSGEILTQDVINLGYDQFSFEEFVELVAAITKKWGFVILLHDFDKQTYWHIRKQVDVKVRPDLVMW